MHIEFLVEDLSTQEACTMLLPKLLPVGTEYEIRSFRGKQDLLSKLPARLRAYRGWLPKDWRIVVLIDRDNENCQDLKSKLEEMSRQAGLITKTACSQGREFQVLNRIMIEELEAWFFGDVEAICQAYSRISPSLAQRASYRDPDAIQSGTWEALQRELQRAGHFKGGLDKVKAAREIAQFMNPEINQSSSFQIFRRGLLEMTS